MEVVGGPGVVVVVDDGGEQQGEDLEVGHPVLQPGLGDDPVRGLQHVAGVQVVVVRVAVSAEENGKNVKFDVFLCLYLLTHAAQLSPPQKSEVNIMLAWCW